MKGFLSQLLHRSEPLREVSNLHTRAFRTPHQPKAATKRASTRRFSPRSILTAEGNSRLESTWTNTPTEIDSFIFNNWSKIVARARHESRNGDHAKKFLQLCRDNIAGPSGFTLQPQITNEDGSPDKKASDAIVDAFEEFSKRDNFSVTGAMSRADLERLAVTEWARSGEFIAVIRRGKKAGPHGIALQIIDPIRLDHTHCEQLSDGIFIKHGIEFNAYGRPLAYHFTKEPPLYSAWNVTVSTFERDRFPAKDVIHIFLPEFVGQKRGLTPMMTALARLRIIQGYEDAAFVNARTSAGKMGFFKDLDPDSGDEVPPEELPMDAEAGVFENIGNREFIQYDPQYPAGEFDPFMKAGLRSVASGLGVSYNNLASDLTSVNFSSIRQGALDEREMWKGLQELFIIHLCMRVFEAWLEHALLNGDILVNGMPLNPTRLKKYKSCTFAGRRWGWIDPSSEIAANEKAIAHNLKSRSQVIREYGGDPWEVWKEIQDEKADMETLGLDPNIALSGATNTQATAPPKDEGK